MDLLFLLIATVTAFIGGFYGAAVGSGGLITIPTLILLGVPIHMAIGTTRPSAAVLEIVSAIRYYKEGVLTKDLIKKAAVLGVLMSIGAYFGTNIVIHIPENVLNVLFAIILLTVTVLLASKKNLGMTEKHTILKEGWLVIIPGFLIGIYGGMFGAASGTFMMFLLAFSGYTLLQGTAMARISSLLVTSTATVIFGYNGLIDIPYAIAVAIGFGSGGWLGAGVGARKGNSYIKFLMYLIIAVSIVKLLLDL